MKLKKEIDELQIGMHVCDLDRPWVESSFLFQGFDITSDKELIKLKKECQFVYIDTEKSNGLSSSLQRTSANQNQHATDFVDTVVMHVDDIYDESFERDIKKAKELHHKTLNYVENIYSSLNKGGQLDIDSAKEVVTNLVEHILSNPDTMVWLSQLKEKDDYTAIHAVNVCILSITFARTLGIPEDELNILGLGALLIDIGKSKIPDDILKKTGSLNSTEFLLMKAHAYLGYAMLDQDINISKEVLDIILSHHERLDGKGYPNGLTASHINRLTRIVSIVDVFDAMTSDRCYKDALQAQHALSELYNMAPEQLDQELVEAFIKCIGIYPVGCIVVLSTGHTGIVVKLNEENKLKPIVGLVLNRNHEPYENIKLLNLSSNVWQKSSGDKVEISKILEPHAYSLDVKSIIKKVTNA